MTDQLGYDNFVRMTLSAVEKIKQSHQTLSQLDAATGDGDHGTTMLRTIAAIEKAIKDNATEDLKILLPAIAWAVMGADGGSTGPLLGSLFLGMGDACGDGQPLGAAGVAAMFEAALVKVQSHTKAVPGDKTMMDALVPAVEALRTAADTGKSVSEAMDTAAAAAAAGAESTASMQARFGRAKNLGERTVGHVDPGATSIACIFAGFAEGLK